MPKYCNWAKGKMPTILASVFGLMTMPLLCVKSLAEPVPIQLQVKPQRCISLHQGQVCYQKLRFSWRTPASGEFCLHNVRKDVAIICWRGEGSTPYEYEFQADESTEFAINYKGRKEALVKVKVQVASVYKTPEKSSSRWRLF